MKASIEDVARQAGVSTATVSRAFSRPDMVSAKTRAKVMEAAQQLDFSVSRMAGILKSGRSHRVALLVGSSKLDWFTSRIIEGLNEVLRSAGYDLVIQPIGDAGAREEFFDELPVRGNADAVIVSSSPRPKSGDSTPRGSRSSASTRPRRGSPPPWASTTRPASG